jgi:hypothetical protein
MFGKRLRARVLPDEADVLEDEREADRRDERHQARLVAQRLVPDPLDAHVDDHAEEHREEEAHEDRVDLLAARRARGRGRPERQREHERRREERDLERAVVDDPVRLEGPEHEVVAVGEVDELDDPVDERVAQGHQGVDRAVGDPDESDFEEAVRRFDRVLDQPVADERRENGARDPEQDLGNWQATLERWSRCGFGGRHRRLL